MKTMSSDIPVPKWIETRGVYIYCFNQKEEQIKDEMSGETRVSYAANYVEVEQKDEALAKAKIEDEEMADMQTLARDKIESIKKTIYQHYPEQKQSQDVVWVNSYTTKLKAMGVERLEAQIVSYAGGFFDGKTLEILTKKQKEPIRSMLMKLTKIAIRSEWAERCVKEGKIAIAQNREPIYPPFPKEIK